MIEIAEIQQTQSAVNIGDLSSLNKQEIIEQSSLGIDSTIPKYMPINNMGTMSSMAKPDFFTIAQGETITGNLTSNDTLLSNNYTVKQVSGFINTKGSITVGIDGNMTYTANETAIGTDIKFYSVTTNGRASYGMVIIKINPKTNGVDDTFTTNEDTVLTGNVTNNDNLVGNIRSRLNSNVSNGSLTFDEQGNFRYIPNANFYGNDSFTYINNNGLVDSRIVTVNLTVNSVNDAPIAVNDNAIGNVTLNNLLANDYDIDSSELNVIDIKNVSNSIEINLDAQGEAIFTGNGTFEYAIYDGELFSNYATVTITQPTNTAPVGINDTYNVTGSISGNILSNDFDVDGDSLTVGYFDQSNTKGMIAINGNGTFTYTPLQGFNGIDTFSYKPYDGIENGNLTTITFKVTQPTVTPITPNYYSHVDGYGLIDASKAVASSINQTPFAEVINTNTYNLDLIKAPEVWASGYTGQGVIVAILDTGFGLNFSGINYWKNVNEIANNGIDDDSNGYIDDYDGWNAYNNNGTITPSDHGSHVMGTVGDRTYGVAYNSQIMPIQVFGTSASWGAVEDGIYYAVANGAKVINMSLGGSQVGFIKNAIAYAESKGVIVVSSAGNQGGSNPLYPAGFATEYGIAVGSVGNNKAISSFSNKAGGDSTMIYVTAPGEDIVSYGSRSGTSMASPHVAGVVALMLSANPNLTPSQVKNILINNTYKSNPTGLQLVENVADDLFSKEV